MEKIESGHECEFCPSHHAVVSVLISGKMQWQYACIDCSQFNFKDKQIQSAYRWISTESNIHWLKVI